MSDSKRMRLVASRVLERIDEKRTLFTDGEYLAIATDLQKIYKGSDVDSDSDGPNTVDDADSSDTNSLPDDPSDGEEDTNARGPIFCLGHDHYEVEDYTDVERNIEAYNLNKEKEPIAFIKNRLYCVRDAASLACKRKYAYEIYCFMAKRDRASPTTMDNCLNDTTFVKTVLNKLQELGRERSEDTLWTQRMTREFEGIVRRRGLTI
jgi:hypothetical protein